MDWNTSEETIIAQTKRFIKNAFGNKADRSGNSKWHHSVEVMEILPNDVSLDVKLAALLHDVVEDTDVSLADLRKEGYSELTCKIVELLTHDKEQVPYFRYVKNIIEKSVLAPEEMQGAVLVKYADICHNTSPERNSPSLDQDLVARYADKHRIPKQMLRTAVLALGREDFDPFKESPGKSR